MGMKSGEYWFGCRAATRCRRGWLSLLVAVAIGTRAPAAILPSPSSPLPTDEMRAHFIDVGQGSSVLLEFSCGAVLIDAGGEKNADFDGVGALRKYLEAFFSRRPDLDRTFALLLITHAHIDHTRGMAMVLNHYRVRRYVDNNLTTGSGGRQQRAAQARRGADLIVQGITQRA